MQQQQQQQQQQPLLPNGHAVQAGRDAVNAVAAAAKLGVWALLLGGLAHEVGRLDHRCTRYCCLRRVGWRLLAARTVVCVPCGGVLGGRVGAGANACRARVGVMPRRRAGREARGSAWLAAEARLLRRVLLVVELTGLRGASTGVWCLLMGSGRVVLVRLRLRLRLLRLGVLRLGLLLVVGVGGRLLGVVVALLSLSLLGSTV